ncbi:hypothetical protein OC834_003687 [Tilletia horrida]|uniref:Ada DNA repair metal-binding domain-containing protein n=1 Tax=Tilletia horrida TaxID=155126 RepID=A0AAN6JI36_9BASI|nr:hypothetical protein OC835_007114 [Tilletia horrida]KAK0522721.1 hypothetical protein OC842_006386 [Tilletia horrida]KAK0529427.1 hypothetical protein OC834_003687 [Tilletia horrida]KAK0555481.1 hypothetical protein OC844_006060 [Tilletia horrida]
MAPNLPVYGASFEATSTPNSATEARSQQMSYMPNTVSSGFIPYHSEAPSRSQILPYAVSPDAVWAQASSSQLMPAIDMPQGHPQGGQHLTSMHESSAMFSPQASAGMPATQTLPTGSSTTNYSSNHPSSYSSHQAGPVSAADTLSWNMFHHDNNAVRQQPAAAFTPTSDAAYPFSHQAVGMAPPQTAQPQMSAGWAHASMGRQMPLKAETLPPNSPGLQEEDSASMHRHVSAPSTPVTALETGRAYSIADFRHVVPPPHGIHSAAMTPAGPPTGSTLHHHAGAGPYLPVDHSRPANSRPATSAGLILDPSPVPYLDRTFSTDDAKFEAVLARSHAADRAFVCAAATTRIYCRPSCASKRPDRSRLRFFTNPNAAEKAEQAGFRPCKRCKPQTPGTADQCVLAVGDCARHMVMSARNPTSATGNDDDDDEIRRGTLKEYSARANLSAFHFHRTFKAVTSVTLGELGKALNTLALQDSLGEWTAPASQSQMAGSSSMPMRASPPPPEDIAHLLVGWSARRARRALGGLAPSTYAAGCPDAVMRFVSTESAFGPVAIAYLDPAPVESTVERGSILGQINSSPLPVAAEEGAYFGQYNVAPHQPPQLPDVLPPMPPSNAILLTCVLGQDAAAIIQRRFPTAVARPNLAPWLMAVVEELHRTGSREVQLPPDIVGAIRRARVYIELRNQFARPQNDA